MDGLAAGLVPDGDDQSPAGRGSVALLAGIPRGARLLDVEFDGHAPYIAQATQTAKARGVGGSVSLRALDPNQALAT